MVAFFDIVALLQKRPELVYYQNSPGTDGEKLLSRHLPKTKLFLFDESFKEGAVERAPTPEESSEYLDLPFPVVFYECAQDIKYTMPRLPGYSVLGGWVIEESPGEYYFIDVAVADTPRAPAAIVITSKGHKEDKHWGKMWQFWKEVSSSPEAQWGEQEVNEKIRIKHGNSNTLIRVDRLIYIKRKQREFIPSTNYSSPIQWQVRSAIRGHWRRVPNVGKDRSGVYRVPRATWVVEHFKGVGTETEQIRVIK